MKRLLAVLATSALLSCQSSDPGASVAPEATGSIALRVQSASPLRAVDSVKVVLSYKQNQAMVTVGDSVPWDRSGVKLTQLPLEVSIRVRMEGWESERGRRLVYWTAETTTTLSKSSPAWDFTSGSQQVPIEVKPADSSRYVGPVASAVAQPSRGTVDGGFLELAASPGVTDSVLFDPARVDSVYVEGTALALEAGMYRIRLPRPDTLVVLLVGRNGLTSTLTVQVAEPPPVVHVPGLGAQWAAPTPLPGSWVGAVVPLAVKVDSGTVDRVVIRFGVGDSLNFDPGTGGVWTANWEPAQGSVQGLLKAYVVGGGKELPLPERNLNVDLVKPRIEPLTFKLDAPFRVGKTARSLEFKVLDTNQTGLTVWANPVGKSDSLVPTITDSGYTLQVLSSVVLHARDRLGNQFDLIVPVVLDDVGPVLARLQVTGGTDLLPGTGAVETTTGEASLTATVVSDSAGVNEVWAMLDSTKVSWDRQTKVLVLPRVGTWTIHASDFLGNESVWGTVVVRYPAPVRLAAPTVTPASGVYGADSLRRGPVFDTLVPHVTCTQGTAQIQVDGQSWRPFQEGKEHWVMAGGEAKASYRCKTETDSSEPVARTWTLLHQPFLSYGTAFYDSIVVHVARNGILPNGNQSTNPSSAMLELCDGDSAACAAQGVVWWPVTEKDTVLRKAQSLTARLMMQDFGSGGKVYSRTLTRVYQRLMSDRVDWSPNLTNNADAFVLKSQFGVVDSGMNTASHSVKMNESILELNATWGTPTGTPYAWVDLPFEADGHPWNLSNVTSFEVEASGNGVISSLSLQILSDVYAPADVKNGLMFAASTAAPGATSKVWSVEPANFALPKWATPVKSVTFSQVAARATGLRLQVAGPLNGGDGATLQIHKIVLKGTMTRVAN